MYFEFSISTNIKLFYDIDHVVYMEAIHAK